MPRLGDSPEWRLESEVNEAFSWNAAGLHWGATTPMQLCVLNPGSPHAAQSFGDYAGKPDPGKHPPLGYHGLAACTGGSFHRSDETIPADQQRVLLVLNRKLKLCRQAAINLRRAGKTVVVAWEKAGASELSAQLDSPGALALFREICTRAQAALAVTPDLEPVFRAGGMFHVETVPLPLPVEEPAWDLSVRPEERVGIWVGTWDWKDPSRRHLTTLLGLRDVASQMYEPVTVFNLDGWRGRRWLRQLGYPAGLLRVIERRIPYVEYLRKMATHRMVFQLDAGGGAGGVAGDALVCRIPCVGGSGHLDRILYPELTGQQQPAMELFYTVSRMLDHGHDRELAVEQALEAARQKVSFERAQQALEQLFHYFG